MTCSSSAPHSNILRSPVDCGVRRSTHECLLDLAIHLEELANEIHAVDLRR
jgi:hypothetical protein